MSGDVLSLEDDRQPGEPLIQPVMQGGRRLAPSPTLAEIRARAARELARLPEPLRQLDARRLPGPGRRRPGAAGRGGRPSPRDGEHAPEVDTGFRKDHAPAISKRAEMMTKIAIGENDVLLVVDIQNDFCPGGALAVPGGDEVVAPSTGLARRFAHVVLTQDWHPPGHLSFASSHAGQAAVRDDRRRLRRRRSCGRTTACRAPSARILRDDLSIPHAELVLRKGFRPRDRFLLGVLRERPHDPDRARRLPARARPHARVPGRARVRFLRALFGRGRASRRLCGRA